MSKWGRIAGVWKWGRGENAGIYLWEGRGAVVREGVRVCVGVGKGRCMSMCVVVCL